MEATAKATYVRISPRKVQIVLDLIRNQPADQGNGYSSVHTESCLRACYEGS